MSARCTVSHILDWYGQYRWGFSFYHAHHKKTTFLHCKEAWPLQCSATHRSLEPYVVAWVVLEVNECLNTCHSVETFDSGHTQYDIWESTFYRGLTLQQLCFLTILHQGYCRYSKLTYSRAVARELVGCYSRWRGDKRAARERQSSGPLVLTHKSMGNQVLGIAD